MQFGKCMDNKEHLEISDQKKRALRNIEIKLLKHYITRTKSTIKSFKIKRLNLPNWLAKIMHSL